MVIQRRAYQFLTAIILLMVYHKNSTALKLTQSYDHHNYNHVDELMDLLFLNRTNFLKPSEKQYIRRLGITKPPYDPVAKVPCVTCSNLKYCPIINGKLMQEVYYPKDLGKKETCLVLDSLGKRMSDVVFGVGKTFRDTSQCRMIVMEYLCLFFASDNDMYTNYCIHRETDFQDIRGQFVLSARPPCRSFCVQVATVCANDPEFIQTCQNIVCPPPTDEACSPDPLIGPDLNVPLGANLGCNVPYYADPYAPKNGAMSCKIGLSATGVFGLILSVMLVMFNLVF